MTSKKYEIEKALQESEKQHRLILRSITDGCWVLDAEWRYTLVNEAGASFAGMSPDQLMGRKLTELFPGIEKTEFFAAYERSMRERTAEDVTSAFTFPDGRKGFYEVRVYPAPDGILCIGRDITRRVQMEEILKESEERYRTLFEASAEGILVADIETKEFKYANPAICRMLGYTEDEIKGMGVSDIHPKNALEHVISEFEAQARGEKTLAPNIPCLRKNGATMYADISTASVLIDGRMCNAGFFTDISARKQAEEALQESEERLRSTISSMDDLVFVLDKDGIFLDYYQPSNRPELYVPPEVFIGKSFKEVSLPPHVVKSFEAAINAVAATDTVQQIDYPLQIADRELWFSAKVSIRKDSLGEFDGVTIVARNITERKRAEEALQQAHRELAAKAAQLEEANAELEQYAYVVSHDLKAPLRAIHNYADFLREDLEETLDGDQKVYLNGIGRVVRQGEELVDALLELFRIGRRSEPVESLDIGVFLRELVISLNLPEDVEVVMENDWPTIKAELTLLRQIFQNLITNAVKFNPSPRKLVEIGWLPIGDKHCELFVRDNGIGIEADYLEQIFRVFQRLHTSEEYEGTGIGLAIVRKAVSKLHGSVRVESKPGEGSTFFVTLPKTQKKCVLSHIV